MRRAVLLLLLAVIGAVSWFLIHNHQTPAQQPRLADLTRASLPGFKTDFNAASSTSRIVILLSPT